MPVRRVTARTTALLTIAIIRKEAEMMKKGFLPLLACVMLVSCTEMPETAQGTYSLSVTASKDAGAKALFIDGSGALKATWAQGETVQVIKPGTGEVIGTLTAQDNGPSTTLSGTISGSFDVGSILRLEFLASNYTSQDGTLTGRDSSIDKTCDYATAEVKVLSIDGDTVTTENATFTNRQAIVKFTLKHADDPLSASELSVTVTGASQSIKISVTPPSPASELYVAIPCFYDSTFSFSVDALSGETHYQRSLESQALENGTYYHYTLNL